MAKVEVKITARDKSNFRKDVNKFLKSKNVAVDRALDATALQIRYDAIQIAPVDKGGLRNSIVIETPEEKTRKVGSNIVYGHYIETAKPVGTGPHGGPKPYLKPALDMNIKTLAKALKRTFKQL